MDQTKIWVIVYHNIMQERIVRYTSEELKAMRHLSLSDWEAVKNMTDDDIDFDDFPDSTDEELATAKHIDFEKRFKEAMAKRQLADQFNKNI